MMRRGTKTSHSHESGFVRERRRAHDTNEPYHCSWPAPHSKILPLSPHYSFLHESKSLQGFNPRKQRRLDPSGGKSGKYDGLYKLMEEFMLEMKEKVDLVILMRPRMGCFFHSVKQTISSLYNRISIYTALRFQPSSSLSYVHVQPTASSPDSSFSTSVFHPQQAHLPSRRQALYVVR